MFSVLSFDESRSPKRSRTSRFPKRKRTLVDYHEDSDDSDDDDQVIELSSDDDEEKKLPVMKSMQRRSRAPRQRNGFQFLYLVCFLDPKLALHNVTRLLKKLTYAKPSLVRSLIYKESFDQMDGPYWIGEIDLQLGRKQAAVNGLNPKAREPERKDRAQRSINAAFLRTNKAVYYEAAPLLYRHPLKFSSAAAMQLFLVRLPPALISHIRHVELIAQGRKTLGRCLQVALALLSPAVNMRVLRVSSIAEFANPHGGRSFDRKLGPMPWNADMTVAGWDIVLGRNMAREAYAQMFPFFESFMRRPESKALQTRERVAQLLSTVRIFEDALRDGPSLPRIARRRCSGQYAWFGPGCVVVPNAAIASALWTPARKENVYKAMGEEIERLVATH